MNGDTFRICLAAVLLALPLVAQQVQEIPTGPTLTQTHALSSSGSWLAIGSVDGVDLLERRSTAWVHAQHLDEPGYSGSYHGFGSTVTMFDEWLAVGVFGASVDGLGGAGAVYLYRLDGSQWERTQVLVAPQPHYVEFFGMFVTLADGFLFVRNHPVFGSARSTMWAYHLVGSRWELLQEFEVQLPGTERRVDFDAPWLIVGEPFDDPHQSDPPFGLSGRVRFFELTDDGFEHRQTLHGSTKSYFGTSVALDGDVALIGAPGNEIAAPGHNRAHVFRLDGAGTWTFEATLAPDVVGADPWSDKFGSSVDLRGDSAVVGAPRFDFGGDPGGATYLFERVGGVWSLVEHLRPDDQGNGDEFGSAVLFAEASILVLAPMHLHDGLLGAVYSFAR